MIINTGCNHTTVFEPDIRKVSSSYWLGPDFWANRLQDWQIVDGKIKCIATDENLPLRTAHVLTTRLKETGKKLILNADITFEENVSDLSYNDFAGFLIGSGGPGLDYRSAALIHNSLAPNAGLLVTSAPDGSILVKYPGDILNEVTRTLPIEKVENNVKLTIVCSLVDSIYSIKVKTEDQNGRKLDRIQFEILNKKLLSGNIALAAHSNKKHDQVIISFENIKFNGDKIETDPSRAFGPIAFAMYTQSNGVLKLTAQMMPLGESENEQVELQIQNDNEWISVDTSYIIKPGFTAPFRIENWKSNRRVNYRVKYTDKQSRNYFYSGIIQAEPLQKDTFKVAALACYSHCFSNIDGKGGIPGWTNWDYEVFENIRDKWNPDDLFSGKNIWFPHTDVINGLKAIDPDLIAFTGDQVYEFKPTRAVHNAGEQTMLDYLYKWYLWGWSFRDMTRNIPTICMPDDHDVYQGNIWGMAGEKSPPGDRWTDGGYTESPEFVNMVQRTQTSHLPDPYDPRPVRQGIEVYYTALDYGGVSFAILEDRKFKSSPLEDAQNVQILGERQLNFINYWTSQWKENTYFKSVITQTIFAGVNTHNGEIQSDKDTNGWPAKSRNNALAAFRKGFAFTIGGDQHLATVVQHGIDDFGDAGFSFVVPSVSSVWPRFWKPQSEANNLSAIPYTGNFIDAFGNFFTLYAVANPDITGRKPAYLHDLATGYGVINFVKSDRSITMECWPRYSLPGSGDVQFRGWPKTINLLDNFGKEPAGRLPKIVIKDAEDPVIQVINEKKGEIIYTLRVKGSEFAPFVYEPGKYTLKAGIESPEFAKILTGLSPSSANPRIIELNLREK